MGVGIIGFELQGLGEGSQRFGESSLFFQHDAQVRTGFGITGLEPQGLFAGGLGLVQAADAAQGRSQVVMRLGRGRRQFHGPAQAADRFFEAAHIQINAAEIVMVAVEVRIAGNCVLNRFDGEVVLALLMGDHAQQVQGVSMVRLDGQDFAIQARGLGHVARLVRAHRLLKNFADAGHPSPAQIDMCAVLASGPNGHGNHRRWLDSIPTSWGKANRRVASG